MRRYGLIILGTLVLAWGILALALGSASLKLGGSGGSAASATSPQCLPKSTDHSAELASTGVDVSPAPESEAANPATQISFMGLPASGIHSVDVKGSQSGEHSGHLRPFSQGDGASFVPDSAFAEGEQVSVHASLEVHGHATAVSYSFHVDTPYPTGTKQFPNPAAAPADYESFYSQPGMQAPILTVTEADRDPAAGDVMTTNGPSPGQYGALIYTPSGRLVWFDHLPDGEAAADLNEQEYEGQHALTWWRGRVLSLGFGQGEDVVMNSHYETVAHDRGGNGLKPDLHEFQLAGDGVAYNTAFNPVRCDLSSVENGSAHGTITDTAVQEIDLKTGLVRWEWHSLDHIAAAESEVEAPDSSYPWDYVHLNSIAPLGDGNLVISSRSTWGVYLLQKGTGTILWRLGGNKSSFKMGPGTKTAWQHDARELPDGDITIFDDGANPPIHSQSRAITVHLDEATHEATLVSALTHQRPELLAASQGNMQTLADGNTLVGYGGVPQISEFAPDGTLLFDAHLPYDQSFYRAYRYPWTGQPSTPPSVLASLNNTDEETIVHASWNGATDVAKWRVLGGSHEGSLSPQLEMPSESFETTTLLPKRFHYVAVQALDSSGNVLGTSHATHVISFHESLPGSG
ncbi:MAG TPA: arylsulfotransferase family protein [Solirubrobacteraceae bacterium]|jgi:hypothetical protein